MSENTDPLSDLGLDLGTSEVVTEPSTDATAPAAAEGDKAKRKEVAIAELEFGFADFIPAQKRGGEKGSKYDFDKLAAPVLKDENDASQGYKYATFVAKPENPADFDAEALKRSVQSATTAANRSAKDDKRPNRYLTRQHIVAGEFVGVIVFRVDATQDTDAEDKAE